MQVNGHRIIRLNSRAVYVINAHYTHIINEKKRRVITPVRNANFDYTILCLLFLNVYYVQMLYRIYMEVFLLFFFLNCRCVWVVVVIQYRQWNQKALLSAINDVTCMTQNNIRAIIRLDFVFCIMSVMQLRFNWRSDTYICCYIAICWYIRIYIEFLSIPDNCKLKYIIVHPYRILVYLLCMYCIIVLLYSDFKEESGNLKFQLELIV